MEVYAFVGPSGTGKSHNAQNVAFEHKIDYIIDDALLIKKTRVIAGKSLKAIIQPDANHLHHKMLKKGFTQKQAVLIMYGLSATFGMFAIILMDSGIWKALSFAIIMAIIVAMGYKEFFKQRLLSNEVAEEHEAYDEKVEVVEELKIRRIK